MRTIIGFLLSILLLAGCVASKSAKMGLEIEEQGDYYRSATLYLESLSRNARQKDAVSGLARVAEPAYKQRLELAQNLVDQGNWS